MIAFLSLKSELDAGNREAVALAVVEVRELGDDRALGAAHHEVPAADLGELVRHAVGRPLLHMERLEVRGLVGLVVEEVLG